MRLRKAFPVLVMLVFLVAGFYFVAPKVTRAECGVYHTVVSGQNLFRISLRYGVSMRDIAASNGITNLSLIYAGQRLFIPCSGNQILVQSTYTYPAYLTATPYAYGTPNATTTASAQSNIVDAPVFDSVDCGGFRATSPLDGLVDGVNTFYWDSPRSVDKIAIYQVVVLDDRGARVATFSAAGQAQRISGDTSFNVVGGRSRFSWYVVALVNGNETCRTQVTTLPRQWNDSAGLSPNP